MRHRTLNSRTSRRRWCIAAFDAATSKFTPQSKWVNGNFFYPAFDVPATVGPANVFPDALVVGTTTDSNGQLAYAGLRNSKTGEAPYVTLTARCSDDSFNCTRWGDYFGGTVDPENGGFWSFGAFAKPKAKRAERVWNVGQLFPWTTTTQFEDVPSTDAFFDFINVLSQWQSTKGCSTIPARFCPGDSFADGSFCDSLHLRRRVRVQSGAVFH